MPIRNMATKKGQKRKTARRAYMPKRRGRTYHKPAKQVNLIPLLAGGYIAGDLLLNEPVNPSETTLQAISGMITGNNPGAMDRNQAFNNLKYNIGMTWSENKYNYLGAAVVGVAADYIGRKTSIGRRIGLKTKKWNLKIF